MNEDPELEISPLSQKITSGNKTIKIEIYRIVGEASWVLEVVDEHNNSTVWDEPFDKDSKALIEAKKTILAEGVGSLIGPASGESNNEWK